MFHLLMKYQSIYSCCDKQSPALSLKRGSAKPKGREKSGVWSRGSSQRAFFTCTNATWHCSVHWKEILQGAGQIHKVQDKQVAITSQPQELPFLLVMGGRQDAMGAVLSIWGTISKWCPMSELLLGRTNLQNTVAMQ